MIPPLDVTPLAAQAIGTEEQPGRLAELWRPLTIRQDEGTLVSGKPSTIARFVEPIPKTSTRRPAPQTADDAEARLEDSLLLRPFYLTNADPAAATRPAAAAGRGLAAPSTAPPLEDALRSNVLLRQLTLSTDEEHRRRGGAGTATLIQSEEMAWEQDLSGWLPSIVNPFTIASHPHAPASGLGVAWDAQAVVFLQDSPQQPADLDADLDDSEETSLAEAEQIGEEPPDTTLDFLRTVAVLLEPGQSQCDVGLHYLFSETNFPILLTDEFGAIVGIEQANFRVRELKVPLQYRLGLVKHVQGFIGTEVGWSNGELSLNTLSQSQNDGGLGDLQFGLTMQLNEPPVDCPYTILTIRATAPTGGDPFTGAAGFAPTAPSLGQGFWSLAGNVLCIQPYDPIVLFYGAGAEYFFSRRFVGVEINPGTQFNYTYGVGFAVNERVTLSGRFFGAYVTHLKVDGERRFKSNFEPMTMRFAATISEPKKRIVEPFVEFGLTEESVSSFFGVTYTF